MTITGTSFLSLLKGLKSSHLLPIADRVIAGHEKGGLFCRITCQHFIYRVDQHCDTMLGSNI